MMYEKQKENVVYNVFVQQIFQRVLSRKFSAGDDCLSHKGATLSLLMGDDGTHEHRKTEGARPSISSGESPADSRDIG
jgi:hypothetical protein